MEGVVFFVFLIALLSAMLKSPVIKGKLGELEVTRTTRRKHLQPSRPTWCWMKYVTIPFSRMAPTEVGRPCRGVPLWHFCAQNHELLVVGYLGPARHAQVGTRPRAGRKFRFRGTRIRQNYADVKGGSQLSLALDEISISFRSRRSSVMRCSIR